MEPVPLLDCAGRRRSPATLSSFHQGRAPRNKGRRYPPDPPSVEEIIAVMRACGMPARGRAAASCHRRALARRPADQRSARAERERSGPPRAPCWSGTGMTASVAWSGWTAGPGSNSTHGPSSVPGCRRRAVLCGPRPDPRPTLRAGRHPRRAAPAATAAGSRSDSRRTSSATRTQSRCPAKGFRCWSSSANRHADLAVTGTYLRGIDNTEIIHAVYERSVPMIPASPRPTPTS